MKDLCVIGLGYIGLPTAAVFAEAGLTVAGVDTDPHRVASVNAGAALPDEPGLDAAITRAVASGRLVAASEPVPARAYIIAVPTPLGNARTPGLNHVRSATAAIARVLTPGNLVILESTVPVGTTRRVAGWLAQARPDLTIAGRKGCEMPVVHVAHCPERVLPGRILAELRENDRIIGGLCPGSADKAARLYSRIARGHCHLADAETAEMAKLAENAFRDVNIAFANELAQIAEVHDIDPRALIRLANQHPRVDILDPGPGVGGHCIAVDPWFLAASAPGRARLIHAARAVNDARPSQVAAQAAGMAAGMEAPTIACFGLAYKRDVGDLRESPAVEVTRLLAGLRLGPVVAVEPHISALPSCLEGVELASTAEALSRADLAVLLVDHQAFRDIPPSALAKARILDTRGIWSPHPRGAIATAQPMAAASPPAAPDLEPAIARSA